MFLSNFLTSRIAPIDHTTSNSVVKFDSKFGRNFC